MPKILKVNATTARKTLFKLVDRVASDNLIVQISKEGTKETIVLQKLKKHPNPKSQKDINIVNKTYGTLKTTGYKSNEFDIAKKHFIKKYKLKNDSQ